MKHELNTILKCPPDGEGSMMVIMSKDGTTATQIQNNVSHCILASQTILERFNVTEGESKWNTIVNCIGDMLEFSGNGVQTITENNYIGNKETQKKWKCLFFEANYVTEIISFCVFIRNNYTLFNYAPYGYCSVQSLVFFENSFSQTTEGTTASSYPSTHKIDYKDACPSPSATLSIRMKKRLLWIAFVELVSE